LLGAPAIAAAAAAAAVVAAAQGIPPERRRSGFEDMAPATQAMQRDDPANPAMLWAAEGEALWSRKDGAAARACAECHGDAAVSMRGVAARQPAWDEASGGPLDLAGRINRCRAGRQGAPALASEDERLLALSAFVALQSRGLPITTGEDARLAPFLARGRALFEERRGQLDLSCAQCHDALWGRHLAGNVIPQGHPTGYPIYRLEWQGVGSLERRLRNCMAGVRSEPYPPGAAEVAALELFLMARARGMAMEAPGVRP
jgi:sulfur-oxidizing protein SoxA